jgi:MFS family permease
LPRPPLPALLRESPEFRRFWNGQAISMLGDQISLIALPLVAVLALDAGPAQMGYLATAALIPNLLFSLHAGAFVDRRGRRRQTMLAADLGRAVLTTSVPVAYALDALTIQQLYVVAFLTGSLSVLFLVSYSTLFTAIVPRERYVEANSLVHGSRALSFVAGPSAGGFLVQIFSAPLALVADAVSFVGSAWFLARLRAAEPPTERAERGHLAAGARFIWGNPSLRASLLSTACINLFNFVFFALFVLFATRTLHVRPGTLGLVLGAGAIGGVIGAVVTRRLAGRIGIGPAFLLGSFLFPAPLVLVPLAGGPRPVVLGLLFLAEFGSGLGVMILDITVGSIFQALVPDRLRARFSGAYMVVNYGVRPIGTFAGGLLGSSIGLRPTLWIATVGATVGALFLLPSPLRTMRELPEQAA